MKSVDFVKMGFKNLWRRKLRTILTIVGVMIGTFSIVIMMSLGIAMSESYEKQLSEWGSLTQITVNKYGGNQKYLTTSSSSSGDIKLTDALVEDIKQIPHVKGVTPTLSVDGMLKSGKYQSYVSITGIDVSVMKYFDYPNVAEGEMLSEENSNGILFGKNACYFYNPKSNKMYFGEEQESPVDLMNDKIQITFDNTWESEKVPKYSKLQVLGVFEESSTEANYSAYADISQVKEWLKEKNKNSGSTKKLEIEYQNILVSVDDIDNVAEVQQKIKDMGYGTYSMTDSLQEMQKTSNMLQLILGGIGAVSLLVSAIGIANTMVMSIYERTKEIGIMKVLGCLVTDVRKLFLFEASIIGFLGGVTGILFSYGISHVLNKYAPMLGGSLGLNTDYPISVIPIWLAITSVAFAMFIGIVSGLYPAKRATKIKALEAMRTES